MFNSDRFTLLVVSSVWLTLVLFCLAWQCWQAKLDVTKNWEEHIVGNMYGVAVNNRPMTESEDGDSRPEPPWERYNFIKKYLMPPRVSESRGDNNDG